MGQIDLRMTPEEKARQQIDAILSRCGWTVQDKSLLNLHTTESSASPTNRPGRIAAEVERRLSVVPELTSLLIASLQRSTRLRRAILQRAFTGELTE
jgi:hypothetical protein